MKLYQPRNLKPSPEDFYRFTNGKVSDDSKQSVSWKVVLSLFQTAQRLYRTLESMTSERLSVFVDCQTYLTPLQEHDLVALTALYVAQLDMATARDLVNGDKAIADTEREVLLAAIDLFQSAIASTCAALNNPRWVE